MFLYLLALVPALALKSRLRKGVQGQCASPRHAVDEGYVVQLDDSSGRA